MAQKDREKPKLRHLAIITADPNKLADFYEQVFEMEVLERRERGAVFVTDGTINLALIPNRAVGKPSGINHFGFEVKDGAEIAKRLEAYGLPGPKDRPANRHYAQQRAMDPDGNNFDISENGYQTVRPEREDIEAD